MSSYYIKLIQTIIKHILYQSQKGKEVLNDVSLSADSVCYQPQPSSSANSHIITSEIIFYRQGYCEQLQLYFISNAGLNNRSSQPLLSLFFMTYTMLSFLPCMLIIHGREVGELGKYVFVIMT